MREPTAEQRHTLLHQVIQCIRKRLIGSQVEQTEETAIAVECPDIATFCAIRTGTADKWQIKRSMQAAVNDNKSNLRVCAAITTWSIGMVEFIALILVAIAVVYSEPGSGGSFLGYVLPLVGLVSAYYLLRFAGAFIVLCGAAAFYFMDLSSPSLFRSLFFPCLLGLSVIAFAIWAWRRGYSNGGIGLSDPGAGGDFGGSDCGGDGGGC